MSCALCQGTGGTGVNKVVLLELTVQVITQINGHITIFFFWPHHTDCGIPVPRPGTKPGPPAVEAQSNNHWTAREFPTIFLNATEDNDNKIIIILLSL